MPDSDMTSRGWRIRVPATSANLGPGFDCFGLAFQRYLRLCFVTSGAPGDCRLDLSGEGADLLPRDRTNLVYRAFLMGARADEACAPGIAARIESEIPLTRGQGSSAAASVAGLAMGQLVARGYYDPASIISQATILEGHPDNVAAAVLGGLTLTREAGGTIYARSIPTAYGPTFVTAVPAFQLPTRRARAVLPRMVPLEDAVFNLRATAWMAAAWSAGDWEAVAAAMDDRLHQPYRAALIPGFADVCAAARAAGALAVCISGSGPTILALTLVRATEVARAMEHAWTRHGIESTASAVPVDAEGLAVVPLAEKECAHGTAPAPAS